VKLVSMTHSHIAELARHNLSGLLVQTCTDQFL